MHQTLCSFMIALYLGIALAAISSQSLLAEENKESGKREEYKSTAKQTEILQDDLAMIDGKEVIIIEFEFPPGWVGEKHYHTGDVFVYVREGTFVVDVEGEGRKSFSPGKVYHEAVNKVMQARNGSQTSPTKVFLFQVGNKGEPLMIKVE